MSRPGGEQMGAFLRHQAPELTRIWRLARHGERPEIAPGLVDGLVESFFDEAGAVLQSGGAPEDVPQRLHGVLRWPPGVAPAELSAEWAIAGEVLQTACDSVNCDPAVAAWLAQAVAAADAGTAAIDGGRGPQPEGIVVTLVFSSVAPVTRDRR